MFQENAVDYSDSSLALSFSCACVRKFLRKQQSKPQTKEGQDQGAGSRRLAILNLPFTRLICSTKKILIGSKLKNTEKFKLKTNFTFNESICLECSDVVLRVNKRLWQREK